ncbi:MAG TPA: farnesyl diphosphate synthase [Pyrinomonadaceae bacterium]|jgi:geranylgeranyl pyrophosphate synthase
MNDLETFFADTSRIVDEKLNDLIASVEIEPKRLSEAIRWSLFAGGKRFRPALVLAVGKTFGARRDELLRAACAFEMIHTYSLIHDDLPAMDDDDLRRGRATCHKKFDEATAILAGDILQSLAFQTIAGDGNLSAEIKVKLVSELAAAAAKMVEGQQLDLDAEGKSISVSELESIHQNKTGALVSAAARAGAVVAGAGANELEAVSNYAASLGLLFQITDDLLDVTQTTEILGKTAGKDLASEKATYPALYGLEEARALAEKVHARAIAELNKIAKDTRLLRDLVDFILKREK